MVMELNCFSSDPKFTCQPWSFWPSKTQSFPVNTEQLWKTFCGFIQSGLNRVCAWRFSARVRKRNMHLCFLQPVFLDPFHQVTNLKMKCFTVCVHSRVFVKIQWCRLKVKGIKQADFDQKFDFFLAPYNSMNNFTLSWSVYGSANSHWRIFGIIICAFRLLWESNVREHT